GRRSTPRAARPTGTRARLDRRSCGLLDDPPQPLEDAALPNVGGVRRDSERGRYVGQRRAAYEMELDEQPIFGSERGDRVRETHGGLRPLERGAGAPPVAAYPAAELGHGGRVIVERDHPTFAPQAVDHEPHGDDPEPSDER